MRVLFLASYFPRPTIPLAGTWALEQAKALAEVATVEVACCTPWIPAVLAMSRKARPWVGGPPEYRWDNVTARYYKSLYYPIRPFNVWAYPDPLVQMHVMWLSVRRRLLNGIAQFRPDILFCHHTAVNGYLASRISRLTGLPYVITDHDFDEIASCAVFPRRRAFFEAILAGAHRQLCVSRRMELDVRRIFPFAMTETVHNGVRPRTAHRTPVPLSLPAGGGPVIFCAGMFTERKGVPLLIQAFSRIVERHPLAVLRIAGDGTQRPEIEKAIANTALGKRVTLLGAIAHDMVLKEMDSCDIFALIAWDEPFGVVYLEAMSAGKPIIACTDAGIADVVRDGVHGILVRPRDIDAAVAALDRLAGHREDRLRMGEEGRRLVNSQLTWTANTRRLCEIFAGAIEGKRIDVSKGRRQPGGLATQ